MRRTVRAASRKALETFVRIDRLIRRRIELDLRNADGERPATPQQLMVLLELSGGSPTVGALAASLRVSPPTVSAAVSTLEQRGWVERSTDAEDRRRTHITLTDEGASVLREIRGAAETGLGGVLENLDDEEIARLEDGLAVLGQALERESEALRESGVEDDGRTRVTSG
jgi:DNA-binding MarR family transcriptional regulator